VAAVPPASERRRPRPGSLERPINGRLYRGTWLFVGLPLLVLAFGIVWYWGEGVHLRDVLLAGALFLVIGHGITVGYHRLMPLSYAFSLVYDYRGHQLRTKSILPEDYMKYGPLDEFRYHISHVKEIKGTEQFNRLEMEHVPDRCSRQPGRRGKRHRSISKQGKAKAMNLLIVDDEEDRAQVMCEALQRLGHRPYPTEFHINDARRRLTIGLWQ
jgi:CheY-like chemotaxis protein